MRDGLTHHLGQQFDVILDGDPVIAAVSWNQAHEIPGRHGVVDIERQHVKVAQRKVRDSLFYLKLGCNHCRQVQRAALRQRVSQIPLGSLVMHTSGISQSDEIARIEQNRYQRAFPRKESTQSLALGTSRQAFAPRSINRCS